MLIYKAAEVKALSTYLFYRVASAYEINTLINLLSIFFVSFVVFELTCLTIHMN